MAKQLGITLTLDIRPASEAMKSFINIAMAGGTQVKAALAGQLPAPDLSAIDAEIQSLDITIDEYTNRMRQASVAVGEERQAEEALGNTIDEVDKKRRKSKSEVDMSVVSFDFLQEKISQVSAELRSAPVGSEKFKALSADLARLQVQLDQTRESQTMYARQAGIAGMGTGDARQAVIALNYTLRDSPYLMQNVAMGVMAISNNVPMLVDGLAATTMAAGSTAGGLKLLFAQLKGFFGISVGFSLLMALFQAYTFSTMGAKDATDDLGESAKKTKKELEEMRKELEQFRASGQKAIEIEITLREDIQRQLKDFRAELESLQGTQTQGLGPEMAPITPETVGRIDYLRGRIEQLEKEMRQTDAYKQFEDTINAIGGTAARVSAEDMAELITSNHFTEAQIEATIKTLREARDQLDINSQAYRDNVRAVNTLEGALSRLRKTSAQTFEEMAGEKLSKVQAQLKLQDITAAEALVQLRELKEKLEAEPMEVDKKIQLRLQLDSAIGSVESGEIEKLERTIQNRLQLGQMTTAQAIEGLEVLRSKIEETKDLTPDQKLTLQVEVQGAIEGIRQTETGVRQSITQMQTETIRSTEERELKSLELRFNAERTRIAQTYKDKQVVADLTRALDAQEDAERTRLLEGHAARRRSIELEIATLKADSIRNDQDREIALIELATEKRRLQIETEIEDQALKNQYLETLELDRIAKIQRVQLDYLYDYIQAASNAIGSASTAFFTELFQGGDSKTEFDLRMLEFRKQEEAIRKDQRMTDEERNLRLRSLSDQRHQYEMRNAQTLAGRIRNALVSGAKAFGQALIDAFNRLLAEMAAKAVFAWLLNIAAPGASSLPTGSPVNNPSLGLPQAAEGGIVDRPTILMAGEAGPEAIIPLRYLSTSIPTSPQRSQVDVNVTGELTGSGLELRALLKRVEKLENKFH